MTTKYDVGDTVLIEYEVYSISTYNDGTHYTLRRKGNNGVTDQITLYEEGIYSISPRTALFKKPEDIIDED